MERAWISLMYHWAPWNAEPFLTVLGFLRQTPALVGVGSLFLKTRFKLQNLYHPFLMQFESSFSLAHLNEIIWPRYFISLTHSIFELSNITSTSAELDKSFALVVLTFSPASLQALRNSSAFWTSFNTSCSLHWHNGAQTWALTKINMNRLQVTQRSMERSMLNLKIKQKIEIGGSDPKQGRKILVWLWREANGDGGRWEKLWEDGLHVKSWLKVLTTFPFSSTWLSPFSTLNAAIVPLSDGCALPIICGTHS